jgi:hypothetical protein
MAKFDEPFLETQEMYDEKIKASELDRFVNIVIVVNNKAKEIFKVNKANELLKYRTGDDIIIVVNEKILDQLPIEYRHIVVEESLASIHYDGEKDKLVISKPDVVTFSGILSKHGFDTWDTVRESIKTLYTVEKEEEA